MKQLIIKLTKALIGTDVLYFDDPVQVKLSPHTDPVWIYGIYVTQNRVTVFNGEEWFEVEETDINADKVLQSLYQRMSIIAKQYQIA